MLIVTILLPLFVSAKTVIICNYKNPEEKNIFGLDLFCH